MKKLFVIFTALSVISFCVLGCGAEEIDIGDIYSEQFKASGAEELSDHLPDDVNEIMQGFDISEPTESVSEMFSADSFFDILSDFFKNNIKTPLRSGLVIISILLFSAAMGSVYDDNKLLKYTVSVCLAATAVLPAVSTVGACAEALKSAGAFMLAFLPVFAAILGATGKTLTAAGYSTVMTVATQTVTSFCSFILVPFSSMQLALGLSSAVSGDLKTLSVSNAIKKISLWSLSLINTVFLGVLGIQTAINSPADDLYTKTAKFIVGTTVPVVGNVVGEALNTVRGCVGLLKSSVMIYGVIAVVFTVLPVIIELTVWRIVFLCCGAVAEILSADSAAALIKAVDTALAFVLGMTALILVMFIISLTVVTVV